MTKKLISETGRFRVWYTDDSTAIDAFGGRPIGSDLRFGLNTFMNHEALPNPSNLEKTHESLGFWTGNDTFSPSVLEDIFHDLNHWDGEGLIGNGKTGHTSMSVGDIVEDTVTGKIWFCDSIGFKELGELIHDLAVKMLTAIRETKTEEIK